MTKLEKELKEKDPKELLKNFDGVVTSITRQANTGKGVITKTSMREYEFLKRELLSRMGVEYEPFSEEWY